MTISTKSRRPLSLGRHATLKRILAGLFALGLVFSLSACGSSDDDADKKNPDGQTIDDDGVDDALEDLLGDDSGAGAANDEGISSDWPGDVPEFDDFTDVTNQSFNYPGHVEFVVRGETSQSWEEILGFYQDELTDWDVEDVSDDSPSMNGPGHHAEFWQGDGDRQFTVGLYPNDAGDFTELQFTYSSDD